MINTPSPPGGCLKKDVIIMMADQKTVLQLLKTARGQIDGIIKMVEDNRYCMDISQQVTAADALLRRVNKEVLSAHLKHCVEHAENDQERSDKIDELVNALGKLL